MSNLKSKTFFLLWCWRFSDWNWGEDLTKCNVIIEHLPFSNKILIIIIKSSTKKLTFFSVSQRKAKKPKTNLTWKETRKSLKLDIKVYRWWNRYAVIRKCNLIKVKCLPSCWEKVISLPISFGDKSGIELAFTIKPPQPSQPPRKSGTKK